MDQGLAQAEGEELRRWELPEGFFIDLRAKQSAISASATEVQEGGVLETGASGTLTDEPAAPSLTFNEQALSTPTEVRLSHADQALSFTLDALGREVTSPRGATSD